MMSFHETLRAGTFRGIGVARSQRLNSTYLVKGEIEKCPLVNR